MKRNSDGWSWTELDVVKQEASGSISVVSYVLGRSQNRIPNPILRDVKNLQDN